ncbi:MAG TPA: helix-turn-helix domain-containing protein [Tepidisphaeraceae bacterium]|nr:helix-turn-helix domain-containing protein [Tepidisphaeraceae bacterium]
MPSTRSSTQNAPSDRYLELVRGFPLKPIRDAQSHAKALRVFRNTLSDSSGAKDYKSVLVTLIAEYEQKAGHAADSRDIAPAEVLRHLLEDRDMSINALANTLRMSQSALSDMFNGRRGWSKSAIAKLSKFFNISPAIFFR